MNTLDYAIILDFQRCKMFNECDVMDEKQQELLNDMTEKAYSLITCEDYEKMLTENDSFYNDVKNYVMKVLKENCLSFFDNRCYGYLIDGVFDMLQGGII